ncbi:MAG: hypothetical protein AUF76_00790 [Acidobacteria bacterium 13_1_20CM_2_65_9]|nr:MAG: hypothetical protein AUF76_00790 [Acidobacteria bacterium 13_1_20CM_2_65_9]
MVNGMRRWIDALWPLTRLVVWLGERRPTRGDAAAARTEGEAALTSQPGRLIATRLVERAAGRRR